VLALAAGSTPGLPTVPHFAPEVSLDLNQHEPGRVYPSLLDGSIPIPFPHLGGDVDPLTAGGTVARELPTRVLLAAGARGAHSRA